MQTILSRRRPHVNHRRPYIPSQHAADLFALQLELSAIHSAAVHSSNGKAAQAGRAIMEVRALHPAEADGIIRRALGAGHRQLAERYVAATELRPATTWEALVATVAALADLQQDVIAADVPQTMPDYSRAYDDLVARRLAVLLPDRQQREIADEHLMRLWSGRAAEIALGGET